MMVRAKRERRSLEAALIDQLRPDRLESARDSADFMDTYIAWSEYGRIIGCCRSYFPDSRLFVVFLDELTGIQIL
ncbi:MAG: hypothetical protein ACRD22_01815 [Terriglobia bacterium]